MQKRFLPFAFLLAPFFLFAQPKIQLSDFATGFSRPVDIAHCGDNRLFIVEQAGKIWILDSLGARLPNFFLDIDPKVYSNGNEQGLLGLAFDPDYAQNGYFYVNYINNNQNTVVSRFTRDSADPNKADPNSELIVLQQTQPFNNHNGGCLKFSPVDGYLYIGLGDGGSGGDPQGNGQKKATFLGKILRIDVHAGAAPYQVPADNPFVGDTQYKPEIWSLGLRNPWRFSFDRLTGDMWIGDVGQNAREEIDYEPAGTGGRNYGWRCYEGTQTYSTSGCPDPSTFTAPVFDYVNPSIGCSVTGGFIYRGAKYSDLYGVYLHADYCSGRWWATQRQAGGGFATTLLADLSNSEYSTFGEDKDGELYVAALASGKIQKIKEICSPFQVSGVSDGPVCDNSFSGTIFLDTTGTTGTVTFLWSNDKTDKDIVYLNPGEYIVTVTNGNGCIRRDTFVIESANPPAATVSVISGDLVLCGNDTTILESSPAPAGFGYQWYHAGNPVNGATAQQLTVTQPGLYTVVLKSPIGCDAAPSAITTITLVVFSPPEVVLEQGLAVLCPGDSSVLGAQNIPQGYDVQWFLEGNPVPGATGLQLTVTEPGYYAVRFSGPCGTQLSSNFFIDEELVTLPVLGQFGDTLAVLGSTWNTYQWYFNGQLIPGATNEFYVATESGLYECAVSLGFCVYYDDIQVELINTTLPVSVTGFSLSPNPTLNTMELRLDLIKSEHVQLSLLDAANRQIFMQTHQNQHIVKTLDLHGLPAGTYFLHVQMESGSFVRKVVKQ